jgi:hypothetical protein
MIQPEFPAAGNWRAEVHGCETYVRWNVPSIFKLKKRRQRRHSNFTAGLQMEFRKVSSGYNTLKSDLSDEVKGCQVRRSQSGNALLYSRW